MTEDLTKRFAGQIKGKVDYQLGQPGTRNRYVCFEEIDAARIANHLKTDMIGPISNAGSNTWWVWEDPNDKSGG